MSTQTRLIIGSLNAVLVLVAACDKPVGPPVAVTARFFNGASPGVAPAAGRTAQSALQANAAGDPPVGRWLLSPDKIVMTLVRIGLHGGSPTTRADVNCSVTYEKSKPGLTQLADCPFTVAAGTYSELELTWSTTYDVVINDPINGFFSTPSGIVTTAPPGGAQPLPVTFTDPGGQATESMIGISLPKPLTISESTPAVLSVVISGLHSFKVTRASGVVSFGHTGTLYADAGRPDMIAVVGTLANVAFYVHQAIGTAGSYCPVDCNGPLVQGIASVSVYYSAPMMPAMFGMIRNGGTSCTIGQSYMFSPKGYPGLDAAGNLGWATTNDNNWSTYVSELRMAEVSNLGGTTTLYCRNISADPAPPGGSYASGAPNIATPSYSLGTYILLAK